MAIWSIVRLQIWYTLWPFDIHGYLVYFPHFGMFYHEKSGNPDPKTITLGKRSPRHALSEVAETGLGKNFD
jgi:hypothetical protein